MWIVVFFIRLHTRTKDMCIYPGTCNEGILLNPPLARPSRFCPRSWSNREWWWIFPELTVTLLVCLYSVACWLGSAQLSPWIFISMTVLMCFTPTRVGLPLNMCTGLLYFVDYPRDEWVAMDASMYDGKIDALLSNKTKRGNNALLGCHRTRNTLNATANEP